MPDFRTHLRAVESAVTQQRSVQGQVYVVYGHVDIIGDGEFRLPINFPVVFTEKPHISGSLETTGELTDGDYPECTVGVNGWRFHEQFPELYVGAYLFIVVGGTLGVDDLTGDETGVIHWRAEGKALTNPVTA